MNLTTTGTIIPDSLIENLNLFEPREVMILLVLFYREKQTQQELEQATGLVDREVSRYIGTLLKYDVIVWDGQSSYSIAKSSVNIDGLRKRIAPKVKQTQITFDTMIDTQGEKIIVNSWENFAPTLKMADVQRKMIYLFFKAVGFDITKPLDYITNAYDWKMQAFELSKIVKDDIWLINAAVDKLRKDGMTIVTIRSILKTVQSLKLNNGKTLIKEESKEIVTDTW